MQCHVDAIHLKIRKFACHICSSTFTDMTPLRYHIQRHKIDPEVEFKCPSCSKSFNLEFKLKQHLRISHQDKVKCEKCDKLLSSHGLKQHVQVHHTVATFECQDCGKIFKHKGYLKKHQLMHDSSAQGKPFNCNLCEKTYSRPEYLNKHKRYKHENSEVGKWECKLCGKTYAQSGGLFLHKKTHKAAREFKCTKCEKEFHHKSVLKRHMFTHDIQCLFHVYIVSDLSLVRVSMIIIRECTLGLSLSIVTIVGPDL